MKLDTQKKEFLKNVLLTFTAFAVYKLIGKFAISHIENGVVNAFASEVTLLVCAFCLAFVTKRINVLKWKRQGIGTGLLVGLFMLIAQGLVILRWFLQYSIGMQTVTISVGEIILFLLAMIMVGISEELMFRGVLLNVCLDFFGETTVSSIRKAIIIAGSIFGAFHIFNVLIGASLSGSIVQAANAIALGIMLGAIYIRSGKNIWPCIILHTIQDTAAFLQSGMMNGGGIKDSVSGYDITAIPTIVLLLLIGFFIMRKKKMSQFVK